MLYIIYILNTEPLKRYRSITQSNDTMTELAYTTMRRVVESIFAHNPLPVFFQTGEPVWYETLEPEPDFGFVDTSLPAFFQTSEPVWYEPLESEFVSDSAYTVLPAFFQTGEPVWYETLEPEEASYTAGYDVSNTQHEVNYYEDETMPQELVDFFDGVHYDHMDEHWSSFEPGNTWRTNPVFRDEFAQQYLPLSLLRMVYELQCILDIRMVVPANWNHNDSRYTSLSESQQDLVRQNIHQCESNYRKLDDLCYRLKLYNYRTQSYQIGFLLNKVIDIVEEVLHKPQQ